MYVFKSEMVYFAGEMDGECSIFWPHFDHIFCKTVLSTLIYISLNGLKTYVKSMF